MGVSDVFVDVDAAPLDGSGIASAGIFQHGANFRAQRMMGVASILAPAIIGDRFVALAALSYQTTFTELRFFVLLDRMCALGFIDADRPARFEPFDMAALNAWHQ